MTTKIIETIRKHAHPDYIEGESEGSRNMRKRDAETFRKTRDAVKSLGDLLNGGDKGAVLAGIVEGLLLQHRYLQNEAIITLLTALGEFGGLSAGQHTDARNEFAHKLCKLLRKRFRDELFWQDAK
jgi:hypothetical protein